MREIIDCPKHGKVILCPMGFKLLDCGKCRLCDDNENLDDILPFGENDHWGGDDK